MPGEILLPWCFALQSKRHERYLRYVHEEGDKATSHGQLQLNGEDPINPFTRFESEPSLLHQGMFHIRCRYHRKYWVARQRGGDEGGWWVVADAHEPEEDLDSPHCTLIKPIISVTNAKEGDDASSATTEPHVMTVRFLHAGHAQPGKDTRITFSDGTAACVRVVAKGEHDDSAGDAFIVLNLSRSPRRLPKFVVFKGHNDRYLSAVTLNSPMQLQFSESDPGHPRVVHETVYDDDSGDLLVRNIHENRYWVFDTGASGSWVSMATRGKAFTTVDLRDFIAIGTYQGQGEQQHLIFLKSITRDGFADGLYSHRAHTTITADARIRVEEPVLDREIYNVEYRLGDARIYDSSVLSMVTTAAVNDTSRENTKRLTLAYEESEMSTWDATVELKLGYKSKIRAGFPKLGLGGTVNISAEFFGAYNWGETMEKKVSHEVEYEVTVPPRTKVTVSLIATRSTVDVPFDYWQRDVMSMDGEAREFPMTDGLYTGINSYNFKFQTTEEKLQPRRRLGFEPSSSMPTHTYP